MKYATLSMAVTWPIKSPIFMQRERLSIGQDNLFGYRDILAFDMLPEGWAPSE
jgi:hypothetical protein